MLRGVIWPSSSRTTASLPNGFAQGLVPLKAQPRDIHPQRYQCAHPTLHPCLQHTQPQTIQTTLLSPNRGI